MIERRISELDLIATAPNTDSMRSIKGGYGNDGNKLF